LPITRVVAFRNKLGSTSIAQFKAGSLRIDSRPAAVARTQTHVAVARHIDAIKSLFLGGKCGLGRVNLKIFMIAIKSCQSDRSRALADAERYAFISQGCDFQNRSGAKPHEVTCIDLNLNARIVIG
jgi:hypothetical protein